MVSMGKQGVDMDMGMEEWMDGIFFLAFCGHE